MDHVRWAGWRSPGLCECSEVLYLHPGLACLLAETVRPEKDRAVSLGALL